MAPHAAVFCIGDFRVDPALDEISKDGVTAKLEPRTMQLLICLAERAGRVVSVEQLLEVVWKDVVVSSDSVYQGVASLRRILGDDPKEPKYIANVMRRGYRLVAAVKELDPEQAASAPVTVGPPAPRRKTRRDWLLLTVVLFVCTALAYLVADRFWVSKHTSAGDTVARITAEPAAAAFSPPPHSIAVLPFVNISGDQEQEYFSDGLTEELLNSLSRISGLQVAARTSSFSFHGEHPDIATVAHKLNVAAVLEGSVRRSAHTVRITAQLVNGITGFHLWSETYDRDLGDVLKLQTEIAIAVADALKVTLLGDEASKIELGGTHDPAALDAYLRASKAYWQEKPDAIDGYTEAIRLDSHYALAYADRSIALLSFKDDAATPAAVRPDLAKAKADAGKAIALAPNLSEGHLAMAIVYESLLAFPPATEEFERALALGAGNARILRDYGLFAVLMGRGDFGLMLLRRALALDPLNQNGAGHLANAHHAHVKRREHGRLTRERQRKLAQTRLKCLTKLRVGSSRRSIRSSPSSSGTT